MSFSLSQLNLAVGRSLPGDLNSRFDGIQFDSREPVANRLFIALRGERVDGRQFVAEALRQGARMALVSESVAGVDPSRQIVVANPLAAIERLATLLRRQVPIGRVIGITGSNGKTTTKELIAAALAGDGPVARSPQSFNNEIGVPFTVAGIEPDDRYAVVELGAQKVGEITQYCRIADPTDAVITNVGTAHIGLFGSRANIARAKGELAAWIEPGGTVVLNADDEYGEAFAERTRGQVRWISQRRQDVDVHVSTHPHGNGTAFRLTGRTGCTDVTIATLSPAVGLACAAAVAVAESLGIHIHDAAGGFEQVVLPPRRMQVLRQSPFTVIDDSYNANCDSAIAALAAIDAAAVPGRRIAVLGEMLELGEYAAGEHSRLGQSIDGLDHLVTVGCHARLIGQAAVAGGLNAAHWRHIECAAADSESISAASKLAIDHLAGILTAGDLLLIKGSNALGMGALAAAAVRLELRG